MHQTISKNFHFTTSKLELPFYEELSVMKTNHAFRGYAMGHKVGIVQKKDQLEKRFSQKQVKQTLMTCLNQITLKVMLQKHKPNGEIEFRPVSIQQHKQ